MSADGSKFQLINKFVDTCRENDPCKDMYKKSDTVNIHIIEAKNKENEVSYYPYLSSDNYDTGNYKGKMILTNLLYNMLYFFKKIINKIYIN